MVEQNKESHDHTNFTKGKPFTLQHEELGQNKQGFLDVELPKECQQRELLLAETKKILENYFSEALGEGASDDIAEEILTKVKPILRKQRDEQWKAEFRRQGEKRRKLREYYLKKSEKAVSQESKKLKTLREYFVCYHVTTRDRLDSILKNGLVPNSKPNWFTSETPYVMLSLYPYWWLYEEDTILLEIKYPDIKPEFFSDPEGLRWGKTIEPKYIHAVIDFKVVPQ